MCHSSRNYSDDYEDRHSRPSKKLRIARDHKMIRRTLRKEASRQLRGERVLGATNPQQSIEAEDGAAKQSVSR